jgi:2-iminobutanoate/2-iminopropanoate deaminase
MKTRNATTWLGSTSRFALFSLTMSIALLAQKTAIVPKGANPAGPYTPGIVSGRTLYVAGQIGRDSNGQIPDQFEDEVKACLENVGTILKEAGSDFSKAVAVQVYLTDMELFERMNKVYMTYFPEPRPARTTVGVAKLVGKARIEITVTAEVAAAKGKKVKK